MNVIDYYLYYKGDYKHSIYQGAKRAAMESAVEAQGEAVAESLLRALEFEGIKAEKTRSLLASVGDYGGESVRRIHQKTHQFWRQPRLSDDEMAELFASDLLETAKGQGYDAEIMDALAGDGKTASYDVSLRL